MDSEFYLTLPSNSSILYYPNNTTTKFSTHLPQQITLKGVWQVALVEFHYPCTFQNVREGANTVYIYTHHEDEDESKYEIHASVLKSGTYYNAESLINLLNTDTTIAKYYQFEYNMENGFCKVASSTSLAKNVTNFELPRGITLQLGMDLESKLPTMTRPCNVRLGLPAELYVYCDVIEPQLIGDTMAPLLRIVSVDKASYIYGDQKTCIFFQPHYVRVLVNQFDNIEVDIRIESGAAVPFQFGTSLVKLHFRRVDND